MDFGIEIDDLADLPDAVASHRLVVRRGRAPTLDQQIALTARLGSVVGSAPDVAQVRYEDDRRIRADHAYFNEQWHADVSWSAEGPVVSVLCALVIGRGAAATSFADTVSGFARLTPAVSDRAATATALHHVERSRHLRHGRGSPAAGRTRRRFRAAPPAIGARPPTLVDEPGAAHPLVVPTRSGPGLTIGDHAWTIDGVDAEQGAAFVDDLQRRVVDAADTYTHRWQRGDVVAFDNRSVLHRREPAPLARRRILRRTIAWPPG